MMNLMSCVLDLPISISIYDLRMTGYRIPCDLWIFVEKVLLVGWLVVG